MISVAMATYNGEKYIEQQLLSIVNQTVSVDEIIICDDCSSDKTIEIIQQIIRKNRLDDKCKVFVNDTNIGFVRNFVKAISLTSGDFVFLSDQDDVFFADKFEKMLDVFSTYPDCVLLNSNFQSIDEAGNVSENFRSKSRKKRTKDVRKNSFREWLFESSFPGFAMGFRACIREKIKNANLENCYGHDQLIGLFAISEDGNYSLKEVLNGYRNHCNNTTGGKNITENYTLSSRIRQKEKELAEYEKLRIIITNNNIQNVDLNFLTLREKELKRRIAYIKNHNFLGLAIMICTSKAYPKNTIFGDCFYIVKGDNTK